MADARSSGFKPNGHVRMSDSNPSNSACDLLARWKAFKQSQTEVQSETAILSAQIERISEQVRILTDQVAWQARPQRAKGLTQLNVYQQIINVNQQWTLLLPANPARRAWWVEIGNSFASWSLIQYPVGTFQLGNTIGGAYGFGLAITEDVWGVAVQYPIYWIWDEGAGQPYTVVEEVYVTSQASFNTYVPGLMGT
jgi:hypothetical protein